MLLEEAVSHRSVEVKGVIYQNAVAKGHLKLESKRSRLKRKREEQQFRRNVRHHLGDGVLGCLQLELGSVTW